MERRKTDRHIVSQTDINTDGQIVRHKDRLTESEEETDRQTAERNRR